MGRRYSGIKAGWPRFDTKRGAQPTSPTAARRGTLICPLNILWDEPCVTFIVISVGRLSGYCRVVFVPGSPYFTTSTQKHGATNEHYRTYSTNSLADFDRAVFVNVVVA